MLKNSQMIHIGVEVVTVIILFVILTRYNAKNIKRITALEAALKKITEVVSEQQNSINALTQMQMQFRGGRPLSHLPPHPSLQLKKSSPHPPPKSSSVHFLSPQQANQVKKERVEKEEDEDEEDETFSESELDNELKEDLQELTEMETRTSTSSHNFLDSLLSGGMPRMPGVHVMMSSSNSSGPPDFSQSEKRKTRIEEVEEMKEDKGEEGNVEFVSPANLKGQKNLKSKGKSRG
jgi:hypothetical protein